MASKICHVVRITNPNDTDMWVEVKVYDVIRFQGPNGQDMVIDFRNGTVDIDDQSGSGLSVENANATRRSTIYRVNNPDDDTYYLGIEILDSIRFKGPNGKDGILHMPSARSGFVVVDTDSTGATGNGGISQVCSTIKVVDPTSDTAKEDETDEFIGVCVPNGIRYTGPNGDESVLYLPDGDEEDTTVYETDDDGNPKAPENTDANKYVTWVDATEADGGPSGPWIKNGDNGYGIDQGILWHITKAAGGHTKPWWMYDPTQQRNEWMLEAFATRLFNGSGVWIGYKDFAQTWHYLPQVCHLEDYAVPDPPHWPGHVIPPHGYDSLDAQARAHAASPGTVPSVTKINFVETPKTPSIVPGGYGMYFPNIWQKTGIDQPFRKNADGSDYIDPDTGEKVPKMPSKKLAERVATEYTRMWNAASDGYNAIQRSFDGVAGHPGPPGTFWVLPYPSWEFVEPAGGVPDPSNPAQRFYFIAGIPAGFNFFARHLDASMCGIATAEYAGVGQLDEKVWDTSGDVPTLRP